MQKKKRIRTVVLAVLGVLLAAIAIFLLIWYCGARYPRFEEISKKEARLPDLSDGLAPQGICILPDGTYCLSGYMPDHAPSRLYVTDGEAEKFVTLTKEGKPLTTHFGGVTCSENYIIVASGKELVRVPFSDVLAAQNGNAVEITDSFATGLQNAFCYYENGNLYAGEFYRPGNYETDESHHLTENGETNYAFVYVFAGDEACEGGVKSTVPEKVISVREQVQGIAVYDGGIVLSTSYGLPDSRLFVYDNVLSGAAHGSVTVGEREIPLYRLDRTVLRSTLTAPCMSEEICIKNDRLYILFESLANRYKYFVRTRMDSIVSIALSDL